MMYRGLLVALLVSACADYDTSVGHRTDEVVYGADDRVELYEHPDAFWRTLASESIVALVSSRNVDARNPEDVQLNGNALGDAYGLCSDERFREQPTAASCSGTLIDLDLVLTAGHCVPSASRCASTRFVFDYYYEADGTRKTIDAEEDVYQCAELVAQENNGSVDYAVVRLDRVVHPSHVPAAVRADALPLTLEDELMVIGFGSGLPMKLDDGGQVTNVRPSQLDWFGANLDTFGGNSGSGVFNTSGEVVGILVRGEGDYARDGGCNRVRTLPNLPGGGLEEECTYVSRAITGLCGATSASTLCEGGGICSACRESDDCPSGFACDAGACVPTCTDADGVCPLGTSCDAAGLCQPDAASRCEGRDVVETRCGRRVGVIETCATGTFCSDGMCMEAADGDSCSNPIEIEAEAQRLTGRHVLETTNAGTGSCAGRGRDTVYAFEVDRETVFRAEASNRDAVLHLRQGECGNVAREVACDDDSGSGRGDSLIEVTLMPGRYYLFMDNFSTRTGGGYVLNVEFEEPPPPPFDAGVAEDGGPGPIDDAGGGPPLDAGFDAPVLFDAGRGSDAAADAGPSGVELYKYGCDCRVGASRSSPPLALGLLLVALVWRRRL